jgi:hypothetical protein
MLDVLVFGPNVTLRFKGLIIIFGTSEADLSSAFIF